MKGAKQAGSGTTAYAWFVWDKDAPNGTELKWFKPGTWRVIPSVSIASSRFQ